MAIRKRFGGNLILKRVYQCEHCGTKQVCLTNHTHDCWPICIGPCRGRVAADAYHPAREYITQTTHFYVEDYTGKLGIHEKVP
jgi:hypothetical protein